MAKIVCIEDEQTLREDVADWMESCGHSVIQAADGEQGLNAILTNAPDLVLCDVSMPKKSGFDVLKELRTQHPGFAATPFIILSALADREHILSGLDSGADDYLTKPIDFDLLQRKIGASLRYAERVQHDSQSRAMALLADKGRAASSDAAVDQAAESAKQNPGMAESGAGQKSATAPGAEKASTAPQDTQARPQSPPAATPEAGAGTRETASGVPVPASVDAGPLKTVYGATLSFDAVDKSVDKLGNKHGRVLEWFTETALSFIDKIWGSKAPVRQIPGGGLVVCFEDADRQVADQQTRQIAAKIEQHLRSDKLDELSQEIDISRERLADLAIVSQALYETTLPQEAANDPLRFLEKIRRQVDKIGNDPTAPARLMKSIRDAGGKLVALPMFDNTGKRLPITFYNFDEYSRENIRSSLAIFPELQREKALYLVDTYHMKLLMDPLSSILDRGAIVVDVSYENADLPEVCAAVSVEVRGGRGIVAAPRLSQCQRFFQKTRSPATSEKSLKVIEQHASHQMVQFRPKLLPSFLVSPWPISAIVLSFDELQSETVDAQLLTRAKSAAQGSRVLVIVRGVPTKHEVPKLKDMGFDGFCAHDAVARRGVRNSSVSSHGVCCLARGAEPVAQADQAGELVFGLDHGAVRSIAEQPGVAQFGAQQPTRAKRGLGADFGVNVLEAGVGGKNRQHGAGGGRLGGRDAEKNSPCNRRQKWWRRAARSAASPRPDNGRFRRRCGPASRCRRRSPRWRPKRRTAPGPNCNRHSRRARRRHRRRPTHANGVRRPGRGRCDNRRRVRSRRRPVARA